MNITAIQNWNFFFFFFFFQSRRSFSIATGKWHFFFTIETFWELKYLQVITPDPLRGYMKVKVCWGFVCVANGNDICQYGHVASHVSSHRAKQRNRQLMNCLHHSGESIKQLAPVTRENPHTWPRLPVLPPLSQDHQMTQMGRGQTKKWGLPSVVTQISFKKPFTQQIGESWGLAATLKLLALLIANLAACYKHRLIYEYV